ncbi:sensor histidine kinase [Sporosarcina jiandibaonis]|uniref:sensor histidine kinase n=1 Tax=Sporosarcina jiandibaonis TaxID=2715535 RepID=UPI0015531381|nr:ATP-binding protein [Sporosarcina jiandibaonis]
MQKVNQLYQFISSNPSSKGRLVLLFRFSSLVLTSFFFLLGPQSPFIFKALVVAALVVAAGILTDLQKKHARNDKVLRLIVLTETIGLTLLLIPTGGISSPFIWYALNPVIVAASFLTPLFCWAALTFYLGSATLIAYLLFPIDSMVAILQDNSYFYLVCLLITLLASLFSGLTKELSSKAAVLKEQHEELLIVNKELIEMNGKYEETLDHIMSLYHLMDNFSSKSSPQKLVDEITTSLLKFTQSDATFVWLTDKNHATSYLSTSSHITHLEDSLKQQWIAIRGKREPFIQTLNNKFYLMGLIRTSRKIGVLGVQISSSSIDNLPYLLKNTFEFLTELGEIMLERIYLDQIIEQTVIIEEQNRIANEIHDSVSQRLFGIVYSLHGLQAKSQQLSKEQLNEEYQFLSQSANLTIKELRSAIFRLSSIKKGEKPFLARLRTYLDDFAQLNDIHIDYQISGSEIGIPAELKQGLYRIISEACGNAVRHGECHIIHVQLDFSADKTVLVIQDDGVGIDSLKIKDKKVKGIGLYNMQNIVRSFNGKFSITERHQGGTEVIVDIPYTTKIMQEVIG